MDDKGFIFTTDATLALVIFMVFTTSFITYQILPNYMGEDHQHLEGLADSALAVMEQDRTLNSAAIYYAGNNPSGASQILNSSLNSLIPSDVGYKITLGSYPSVVNNRDLLYSNDVVTRVKVISGPQEGWVGRAWYKLEEVEFENQTQNVTTTLWNFHNWLSNFSPWRDSNGHARLASYPYWGSASGAPNTPINIQFSIPNGAIIQGGLFLAGSCNQNRSTTGTGPAYGVNFTLNGYTYPVNANQFTFLYKRPPTTGNDRLNFPMYNYQGVIDSNRLTNGVNNYNVKFTSPVYNYIDNDRRGHDMPWFSVIGNYTTNIEVPKGLNTTRIPFTSNAGLAVETAQDLNGDGTRNEYGRVYDINTGSVTSFTNLRTVTWNNLLNRNHGFDNGVPFVITGLPGNDLDKATAVSIVQDVYVPPNTRLFDAFTVVNAYGGVDNALVEVWDGTRWNTAFCSFNVGSTQYSARSDGYGNIPGIIYIGPNSTAPLQTGNNKVRITVMDQVPGNDYDLTGLVSCYTQITSTKLPIKWENFPYQSYQSNNNQRTQTRSFTVGADAQKVLFFAGVGTDSRNIKIEYPSGAVLYNSATIPYSLDLTNLDAAGPHVFTNGTPGNYTLKPGTYNLKVTVTGPTNNWESGDNDANAEIFSGSRIAVLYPKFLENVWTTAYADNAPDAEDAAYAELISILNAAGITPDQSLIRKEAMYAGDLPNAIPVRLELWRK
jgi:hypothetical protein